jgi:multiple sugar transport system ATP-binding protein
VNLFVAGFIGSPAMNFFSAKISGGTVQLPFAKVPAPEGIGDANDVIVGIRPEDFEDARFAPADRPHGVEFDAPIELVESMGSEIYVYFSFQGGEVSSDELAELARDSGIAETPGGGAGRAVARLNPESDARPGQTVRLWFDAAKLHLFDAADGASLRHGGAEHEAAAEAMSEAVAAEAGGGDEAPEPEEDEAGSERTEAEPDERPAPE